MNSNNDLMPDNWRPSELDQFEVFMNAKKNEYNRTHAGVFNTVHVTNWAHEFVRNIQTENAQLRELVREVLNEDFYESDETFIKWCERAEKLLEEKKA